MCILSLITLGQCIEFWVVDKAMVAITPRESLGADSHVFVRVELRSNIALFSILLLSKEY